MKILVFTNYDKIRPLNADAFSTEDTEGTRYPNTLGNLLRSCIFIYRDGSNWLGCYKLPANFNSDFVLIKDNIDLQSFNTFYSGIKDCEHYVIYHTKPNSEEFAPLKNAPNWKYGNHIVGDEIYQHIVDCIAKANGKNGDKIVKEIDEKLKLSKDQLDKVKKDFLEYIYNGNLPIDYQIPQSIVDVVGINELIQYFKINHYQKNDNGSDLCSESNIKYVQLMTLLGFKR